MRTGIFSILLSIRACPCLSLFGYDVEAGETTSALNRLKVLNNPSEREILDLFDTFAKTIY